MNTAYCFSGTSTCTHMWTMFKTGTPGSNTSPLGFLLYCSLMCVHSLEFNEWVLLFEGNNKRVMRLTGLILVIFGVFSSRVVSVS